MKAIFNNTFGRVVVFLVGFFIITLFFFGWDWDTTWKFVVAYLLWSVLFMLIPRYAPGEK